MGVAVIISYVAMRSCNNEALLVIAGLGLVLEPMKTVVDRWLK